MSVTNYCRKHRGTATNLRCSKCDDLICPRCLVHTPVGARCRDCSGIRRLPTFDVTGVSLIRAVLASLVIGIGGGIIVGFLAGPLLFPVPFLDFLVIVGLGYLIGEGTSVAANRKRGRSLQYVAAAGMLLAYAIIIVGSPPGYFNLFTLFYGAIALYIATTRVR